MSFLDSLIYGVRSIRSGSKELPVRNTLNFTGSGVTVTDNAAKDQTDIVIDAGGGGAGEGVSSVATLNDLRNIASSELTSDSLILVKEVGTLWRYDPDSGANEIDDSNLSVKPNSKAQSDPGRWRPVISHGKPGKGIGPGVSLPVSYLPAGVNVIGAKPITDGSPAGPSLFAGFAVDRGDEAGVKRLMPTLGLTDDGNWGFFNLDWSTLQRTELFNFRPNQLVVRSIPDSNSTTRIIVRSAGGAVHPHSELSLEVSAGDQDKDDTVAGDLTLRGGSNNDVSGTGGDIKVLPGKSGVDAARRAIAALCDEDGNPVVTVTKDKLAFFNGSLVEKPTVGGSWSDGTAMQSMLNALVALGLVEDQTTP